MDLEALVTDELREEIPGYHLEWFDVEASLAPPAARDRRRPHAGRRRSSRARSPATARSTRSSARSTRRRRSTRGCASSASTRSPAARTRSARRRSCSRSRGQTAAGQGVATDILEAAGRAYVRALSQGLRKAEMAEKTHRRARARAVGRTATGATPRRPNASVQPRWVRRCGAGSCSSRGGGLGAGCARRRRAARRPRARAGRRVPAVDPDGTLQAFADTIVPGRKVAPDRDRRARSTRRRSRASTRSPARSRPTRSRSTTTRRPASTRSQPAFLADLDRPRGRPAVPRRSLRRARRGVQGQGLSVRQPRPRCSGRPRRPCRSPRSAPRRCREEQIASEGRRLPRHGPAGRGRTATAPARVVPAPAGPRAHAPRGSCPDGRARRRPHRRVRLRRVDHRATGSPSSYARGGHRPALDRRARARPAPRALRAVDAHRPPVSRIYLLDPGRRRADRRRQRRRRRLERLPRRVAARAARDVRAPRPPPRRRPGAPHVAGRRSRRATLDPYYARAEAALRVARPVVEAGLALGRPVGEDARRRRPHVRPRAAGDRPRPLPRREVVPHRLRVRREELGDDELPRAPPSGSASRSARGTRSSASRQSSARPYRYVVSRAGPTAQTVELECKVLVLAGGAMANAPLLMRSRPALPVAVGAGRPAPRRQRRPHRRDRVRRAARSADVLGLPGYRDFHVGKPITTMTYDFWVGRRANRFDGTRFTLQEIFLSTLTNFLYDDGRAPAATRRGGACRRSRRSPAGRAASSCSRWSRTRTTAASTRRRPAAAADAAERRAGRGRARSPTSSPSSRSACARRPTRRCARIARRRGLGEVHEAHRDAAAAYASHPLGGCRMAASPDLGVVDHRGAVFGYEGLYCIDSSIVPTSLGVNPSLTIAALAERCAERLVARRRRPRAARTPAELDPGGPMTRSSLVARVVLALAARRAPRRAAAHRLERREPVRLHAPAGGLRGDRARSPGADPYCVEFDKRRQNVTELGIVDFLEQGARARRGGGRQVLLLPVRPLARLGRPGRRQHEDLRVGRPLLLRQGARARAARG